MESAKVWLIAEESGLRQIMRSLLGTVGFRDIHFGKTMDDLEEAVTSEAPDVVFLGSRFNSADVHKCIRDIRHGRMGNNPFLPIVSIADNPTHDLLKQVSDSGSDDLLAIPLAQSHIEKRIGQLIDHRKPFVVTSQYIGPDRRAPGLKRSGSQQVPLIDVPNTLRAVVTGEKDDIRMDMAIRDACAMVDAMRVDRNVEQIMWLTNRILPGFAWADGGPLEAGVETLLADLTGVADDMLQRVQSLTYSPVRPMCETLVDVAEHLLLYKHESRAKSLKLLPELAIGIKVGMGDIRGTPKF